MDGDRGAQTAALPSERVLRWVAGVVGGMRVVLVENPSRSTHRPSGTFRVRVDGTPTGATDLILKLLVSRWITDGMVITNARALGGSKFLFRGLRRAGGVGLTLVFRV